MKKQYAIIMKRNMYQPCHDGRDHARALTPYDIDGTNDTDPALMGLDDARKVAEGLDGEVYVTSNGEASRPDYWIVPESSLDALQRRWDDQGNYGWPDNGDPCTNPDADRNQCGQCAACIEWMLGQDDELLEAAKME